jgi:thiamine transporter ThiT
MINFSHFSFISNIYIVQNELQAVKAYQTNKTLRHAGTFKQKSDEILRDSEMYDWIMDIDLLTSVLKYLFWAIEKIIVFLF